MATVRRAALPRDNGILREAAQHDMANVGVYAAVVHGGPILRGDMTVLA